MALVGWTILGLIGLVVLLVLAFRAGGQSAIIDRQIDLDKGWIELGDCRYRVMAVEFPESASGMLAEEDK